MRVGLSTVEMFPGLGVIFKSNKTFELSTCYRSNLRTICPIKCCGLGLSLTGLYRLITASAYPLFLAQVSMSIGSPYR